MEHHPVAWPCSNKLAGRVSHIVEIAPCQLLRNLSNNLIVIGLCSLGARAGSDTSVK